MQRDNMHAHAPCIPKFGGLSWEMYDTGTYIQSDEFVAYRWDIKFMAPGAGSKNAG